MRRRALRSAIALAVVVTGGLAACGNGDDPSGEPSASTATSSESTSSEPTPVEPDEGDDIVMGGDFVLTTADGTVQVAGPATSCVNPDEGTLDVVFGDDATTVVVALALGTGTVASTGDQVFDGSITEFTISDSGGVSLAGNSTAAAATAFTLTGQCVP